MSPKFRTVLRLGILFRSSTLMRSRYFSHFSTKRSEKITKIMLRHVVASLFLVFRLLHSESLLSVVIVRARRFGRVYITHVYARASIKSDVSLRALFARAGTAVHGHGI